jgi:DNA-binding response OmpR family regulator
MMPELDSYEFFKKVSENPKLGLIPFLFVSARASPEEVRFGKMLGFDDYLTKPLDFDLLLAIIAGKISRKGKADLIRKKMEEDIFSSLNIEIVQKAGERSIYFTIPNAELREFPEDVWKALLNGFLGGLLKTFQLPPAEIVETAIHTEWRINY